MFWTAIAVIVVAGYYFDLQKSKLQLEKRGGANSKSYKRQVGELLAENEDMKERIRNLEYLVTEKKDFIDIDYEKEQLWVDNKEQKFKF